MSINNFKSSHLTGEIRINLNFHNAGEVNEIIEQILKIDIKQYKNFYIALRITNYSIVILFISDF